MLGDCSEYSDARNARALGLLHFAKVVVVVYNLEIFDIHPFSWVFSTFSELFFHNFTSYQLFYSSLAEFEINPERHHQNSMKGLEGGNESLPMLDS